MNTPGMYIPELNLIILDGTRCEVEQQKCLLHEMAHAKCHRNNHVEYKNGHVNRIKMEHEANHHMINELIDHTLMIDDIQLEDLNWLDFADTFGLDPIMVQHIFEHKKTV